MRVDDAERLSEFGVRRRMIDGQERSEQAAVNLGVEDGDAHAIGSEDVGVGAGQSSDQTFTSQAAQVVRHL